MSRVVVGVSGSAENWQTLSWAVAEAADSGRHLVICHACAADSTLATPGVGARMTLLELAQPALARGIAAARLRLGEERVTLIVRAEAPDDLLVDVANPSDLLVVGSPAHPGLLERGSTTHRVARQAQCPVVVVRPSSSVGDSGPAGPFRGHVVVGVDGSAATRSALEFGFAYAAEHRRPLAAVHVTPRGGGDVWIDEQMLETHLTVDPAALSLLAEDIEPCQHKYPNVAVQRGYFVGRPLEALLRASNGATLLIVGRSRKGHDRRLLGSVVHGIDRARAPLAVVCCDGAGEEAGP